MDKTPRELLKSAPWDDLRKEVNIKLNCLQAMSGDLPEGASADKIVSEMLFPAIQHLAAFLTLISVERALAVLMASALEKPPATSKVALN